MARQSNLLRDNVRSADPKAALEGDNNVLSLSRSPPSDHGTTALNLVYQAAEIFSEMEEQAREIEARAQSLCQSAADRLKLAERRIEVAEQARRELINDAECKLQDASRALKQAEKRIVAAEDRETALEFRAQAAEAQLRDAKQALLLVEDAIRKRLLSANPTNLEHSPRFAPIAAVG
jgi:hypothetical protein